MDLLPFEVTLRDIWILLGESKKPFGSGLELFDAKHISRCGIKSQNSDSQITVCVECLSGSKIKTSATHYSIEITITLINNCKSFSLKCNCASGEGGKCKHIFASLIFIHEVGLSNVPELSVTDFEQQWGKLKKSTKLLYQENLPISEYCHYQHKDAHIDKHDDLQLDNFFLKTLIEGNPKSEAAIHYSTTRKTSHKFPEEADVYYPGLLLLSLAHSLLNAKKPTFFRDLPLNEELSFYKTYVFVSWQQSVDIFIKTINQNTELWKYERSFRITGSICYEIFTYAQDSNAEKNWGKKVQNLFFNKFQGNKNTDYGKLHEKHAIHAYEKIFNCNVEHAGLLVPTPICWTAFSADGIIWDQKILLECKCPIEGQKCTAMELLKKLSYIVYYKNEYSLRKNHKYYAQIQLGMLILGFEKCHFIIYASFDDTIATLFVPYDEVYVKNLVNHLHGAYFHNILPELQKCEKQIQYKLKKICTGTVKK